MAEGSQLAVANARVRRHAIRCDATSASSPRRFAENFPLRVGQRTAERVAGLRLHKTGTLDATEELRLTHGGEFRRWCRDAEQSSEVVVVTRGDDPLTIGRWSNCASPPACTARVHRPRAPPPPDQPESVMSAASAVPKSASKIPNRRHDGVRDPFKTKHAPACPSMITSNNAL